MENHTIRKLILKKEGQLFLFFIGIAASFFSAFTFKLNSDIEKEFGNSLTFSRQTINEIYNLDKGESYTVNCIGSNPKGIQLTGIVFSHINKGEKSGAIRMDLNYQEAKFRMLLLRKELKGELKYQISIIQAGGGINFKLKSEERLSFILEKTKLENIVTQ